MINPGKRTFPNAMERPNRKVPISRYGVVPNERITIPKVNKQREANKVFSKPKRRANFGAKGEMSAKASNGMVVRKPASTFETSKEALIEEINGPTEVKGDRRVEAIKTIPIISNQ